MRGLVQVDGGSKYVHLAKDKYGDLCRCLLGASERRANMGKVQVLGAITALRNAACNQLLAELVAASTEEPSENTSAKQAGDVVDLTAALGFDEDLTSALGFDDVPTAVESPTKRPRAQERRKLKSARSQLPSTTVITYPARLGQPSRELRVLCEIGASSKKSASLELTAGNMEWLRGVVRAELGAGSAVSSETSSASASSPSKRSPRGAPGNREYFVASRNRWVRKCLVQGGKDGQRRYRVLTRRPTPTDQPAA